MVAKFKMTADAPQPPSERAFGLVWAALFAVLGAWPLISGERPRVLLLAAAAVLAAISVVTPKLLAPLNIAWHRLGLALHRIVSPVVLAALFYLVVTPMGVAMRLANKNLLQRRKPECSTYWEARNPAGPERGSMRDQF